MPNCEHLEGCPFFNGRMQDLPGLVELYKEQFCRGDFSRCARHMVRAALGKQKVPMDLYPPQRARAHQLIGGG